MRGAIAVNLDARTEEMAEAVEIERVAAKSDNRSMWASAGSVLTHNDAFGGAGREMVAVPDVPRSYMRITPAGWKNGPPSISDIAQLAQGFGVEAPSEGSSSGSFGATAEGFVRYWITGRSEGDQPSSTNMALFFEDTGEFWMLHGSAIAPLDGQWFLRDQPMLGWWSRTLRTAITVMDRMGAREARVVEAGLFNVKDVRWYAQWASDRAPSRRNETHLLRQSRDWSPSAQLAFLTDAYNRARGLFALPRRTEAEITEILAQFDPQRFAESSRLPPK